MKSELQMLADLKVKQIQQMGWSQVVKVFQHKKELHIAHNPKNKPENKDDSIVETS